MAPRELVVQMWDHGLIQAISHQMGPKGFEIVVQVGPSEGPAGFSLQVPRNPTFEEQYISAAGY